MIFERFKICWIGFIIIAGVIVGIQPGLAQGVDYQQQVKQIAQQLVCLCGCGNQILSSCTCGEAQQDREFILKKLKQGKSEQEILDIMVKRYGEQVLAAPKREGINWIVWVVVPYIIPVLGAIGLGFMIWRWSVRRKDSSTQPQVEGEDHSAADKYKQKLEEELKDFE
jgi:cytochrome c-type biogenesis protein CcmH